MLGGAKFFPPIKFGRGLFLLVFFFSFLKKLFFLGNHLILKTLFFPGFLKVIFKFLFAFSPLCYFKNFNRGGRGTVNN